jgi:hypothetical protein
MRCSSRASVGTSRFRSFAVIRVLHSTMLLDTATADRGATAKTAAVTAFPVN